MAGDITEYEVKKYYDWQGESDDHQRKMYGSGSRFQESRRLVVEEEIDDYLLCKQGLNFLEVGGAEGLFARRAVKSSKISINVDISMPKLLRAKKHADDCEQIQADAAHLPFREKSFDIVICVDVLRYLLNPREAIKEIFRVSKERIVIQSGAPPLIFYKSQFVRRDPREVKREFVREPFGGAIWAIPSRSLIGISRFRPTRIVGILNLRFQFRHFPLAISVSLISNHWPFNRLGQFVTVRFDLPKHST